MRLLSPEKLLVNIINEGWHRALKALCMLPSCYVLLCGAIEILRIHGWEVLKPVWFLCCLLRALRRAGLVFCWVFLVLGLFFFFFSRDLN